MYQNILPFIKPNFFQVFKQLLPEESLYTLNGQIVELKPVSEQHASQPNCDNLAEEAEDELLDLAISEEANNIPNGGPRRPSLGELGYGPAKRKYLLD